MQEMRLTIPCFGYRIETRKRTVDRDSAPEVLTVAVQQKITDAIRNDNDVTITKHVVVCSSCGKETPAYPEFLIHDSWGSIASLKRKSRSGQLVSCPVLESRQKSCLLTFLLKNWNALYALVAMRFYHQA